MNKPLAARLRTYHRWCAAAAMVVLTWIAVTGLALMIDLLTEPRFPAPPPKAELAVERMAQLGGDAAAKAVDLVPVPTEIVVKIGQAGGEARIDVVEVSAGVRSSRFIVGPDGALAAGEPPRAAPSAYLQFRIKLHQLLERLHRGNIIGLPGQLLSVLGGLSFVFLTVSGVWMYVDLLLKRRRLGRAGLFWKA